MAFGFSFSFFFHQSLPLSLPQHNKVKKKKQLVKKTIISTKEKASRCSNPKKKKKKKKKTQKNHQWFTTTVEKRSKLPLSLSLSNPPIATPMASTPTILTATLFLFLFLLKSTISQPTTDCTGRWIHIRRLPTRFNLDLLFNCSQYPLFDNFCSYLPNHGLGQKTHPLSRSWFRTDPLMLELIFHRRMLEYSCLTTDPSAANAVYLPYYAAIDALRYLYGPDVNASADHGLELFDFLQEDSPGIWARREGHDHFLVMARPSWDFSQPLHNDPPTWGTSFLQLPEFYNVTALTLEARAWPWQDHAVPYPTSFHPPTLALLESWMRRVMRSRRSTFMLFAGGGGVSATPNIRRSIRNECASNVTQNLGAYLKLCDVVDCSNGVCEHDPIRYLL
jgi:hypothetical protein